MWLYFDLVGTFEGGDAIGGFAGFVFWIALTEFEEECQLVVGVAGIVLPNIDL